MREWDHESGATIDSKWKENPGGAGGWTDGRDGRDGSTRQMNIPPCVNIEADRRRRRRRKRRRSQDG